MFTRTTTTILAAATAVTLSLSASASAAGNPDGSNAESLASPDGRLTAAERTVIRQATAHFRDVDRAMAAGEL